MEYQASQVYDFWFKDLRPAQWFKSDESVDEIMRTRFAGLHKQAAHGELEEWRKDEIGALCEVIVLDQFSRNLFRNTPDAFAYDGMALVLAQEAIRRGLNAKLPVRERSFLYMPFMHSESLKVHKTAVKLFSDPGLEYNLKFEVQHKIIIEQFGRYPHRNRILNRNSTPEEIEFLKQPDSSF